MAKLPQGILGPVSGSVGTIVGASWKDTDYIRSKSSKPKGDPSPTQLDNRFIRRLCNKPIMSINLSSNLLLTVNCNRIFVQ
jgi:hypothetical protein